jgi:hypothetical protein
LSYTPSPKVEFLFGTVSLSVQPLCLSMPHFPYLWIYFQRIVEILHMENTYFDYAWFLIHQIKSIDLIQS